MRHTQIYRSGRGRRGPRPVRIQALDRTRDDIRNIRLACGCLLLAGAVLLGLCAAGGLFLARVFLLDW